MPTHDPLPSPKAGTGRRRHSGLARTLAERIRRARRGRDGRDLEGGEGVPVTPDRPNNLSGGAAAALEFDD